MSAAMMSGYTKLATAVLHGAWADLARIRTGAESLGTVAQFRTSAEFLCRKSPVLSLWCQLAGIDMDVVIERAADVVAEKNALIARRRRSAS